MLMIFSRKNVGVLGTNILCFGDDPVSYPDPGSFFRILYHQQ